MPLTDTALRNVKPGAKPFKLYHERGLFLIVTPTGGKWWRFKYRFDGKHKTLSLGVYPDVSLKKASKRISRPSPSPPKSANCYAQSTDFAAPSLSNAPCGSRRCSSFALVNCARPSGRNSTWTRRNGATSHPRPKPSTSYLWRAKR